MKKIVKTVAFRGNSGNSGGDGVLNSNQRGTGRGKTARDLKEQVPLGSPWHPYAQKVPNSSSIYLISYLKIHLKNLIVLNVFEN